MEEEKLKKGVKGKRKCKEEEMQGKRKCKGRGNARE